MTYLAHNAHAQMAALLLTLTGWTLAAVSMGLIQWRVWEVPGSEVVTSGVAWVGMWRACFHSHTHVSEGFRSMFCRFISLTQNFTPAEMAAGQVLMPLSLLVGLCGKAAGLYAMRNAYFGGKRVSVVRWGFLGAGLLVLLAAALALVPLVWNLISVVRNQTIDFPDEFQLPEAPTSQHVGCGIGVGMVGSLLMAAAGMIFCSYRPPGSATSAAGNQQAGGEDNPAFQTHEVI